ncbi:hypothetical protein CASFOL_000356 [Castilleja foliolosa]|uniref:DUF7477 domain-containing protein n=1 Tax=Castilleja foliolosa TaxID=1961234 RepID=A0ABD3ESG4_9LAMI
MSMSRGWISKQWKEGSRVTAMATSRTTWAIVMSRGTGFSKQVVELDFGYPSEGIHKRFSEGYRITSTAATSDQTAIVLSIPKIKNREHMQETLRTTEFPSALIKEKWGKHIYVDSVCYGRKCILKLILLMLICPKDTF